MIDYEYFTLAVSIIGGCVSVLSLIWVKMIMPVIKFIKSQESVSEAIHQIKNELTTNGGNSLKDSFIDLQATCNRMEVRQKIMEQRTKAALHYSLVALFETDSSGRIVWSNENFNRLTNDKLQSAEGYDWISYILESDREDFLLEFKSCLTMNRKFMRTTNNCNGKLIRMVGFPYKINEVEQGGFLVSVTELK